MMQMLFYRWIGLGLVAGVFCGCSEKVETEEKKTVVEEEVVEVDPFSGNKAVVGEQVAKVVEVDPLEEIIAAKLRMIIIPNINFEDVSFEEGFDYLRLRLSELDNTESDPTKRGMSFVIRRPRKMSDSRTSDEGSDDLLGGGETALKIPELRVRNVSFAAALRYMCLMTDMRCELDYKLTFAPRDPKVAWDSFGSVIEEKGDTAVVSAKLSQIRLPNTSFEDVCIYSAIDYLRLRSAELDVMESDPKRKGINFVVYVPKGMDLPTVDELRMRDASFEEVLKEICSKTGMRYELDQYSVILVPKDLK